MKHSAMPKDSISFVQAGYDKIAAEYNTKNDDPLSKRSLLVRFAGFIPEGGRLIAAADFERVCTRLDNDTMQRGRQQEAQR